MKFQRTPFGFLTGTFLLIISCIAIVISGIPILEMSGVESGHFMVVLACLFFIILFRIYLLLHDQMSNLVRTGAGEQNRKRMFLISLLLLVIAVAFHMGMLFFYEVHQPLDISSLALTGWNPEIAWMNGAGEGNEPVLVSIYRGILRSLLYFLGNKGEVVIVFHGLLQLIAMVLFFLRYQREAGAMAGCWFLLLGAALPFIAPMDTVLSADMLGAVCLGLLLLLFSVSLSGILKRNKMVFLFLLTGIYGGAYTCLDFAGILLLIAFIPGIIWVKEEPKEKKSFAGVRNLAFGLLLLGWVCGFAAGIGACAFYNELPVDQQFLLMLKPYRFLHPPQITSIGTGFEPIPGMIIYTLTFCMAMHVFLTKRCRGITDMTLLILLLALQMMGVMPTGWHYGLAMLWIMLSGYGIRGFADKIEQVETVPSREAEGSDRKKRRLKKAASPGKPVEIKPAEATIKEDPTEEGDGGSVETDGDEPSPNADTPVLFIPNPLPIPKRREHKDLDYAVTLDLEEDMEFPVAVSDEDDYDIR